jgi:hypothetical protein
MRWWISSVALVTLWAGQAVAGDRFAYRFPIGEERHYRQMMVGKTQVLLPDGSVQTSEFVSKTKMVQAGALAPAADGTLKVSTRIVASDLRVDGQPLPAPPVSPLPRVVTIKPTGEAADASGADKGYRLPVVFPERELARGESFDQPGTAEPVASGLSLRTTYTLADPAATLVGFPRPVAMFTVRVGLADGAGGDPGRKLTMKKSEGRVWFDNVAGTLLKSSISYAYEEDVSGAGGRGGRKSVAVAVELTLEQ